LEEHYSQRLVWLMKFWKSQ